MKKTAYIAIGIAMAALSSSCDGTKDYDAYIERLQAEEAAIENISTPAEYAAYVERFVAMTDSFDRLDVKLNPTQADEIKKINMRITERINGKYEQLAVTQSAADTVPSL